MKIFPYTLARVSGTHYNELENLRIDSSFINKFHRINKKKDGIKQNINNELYDLIGALNDAQEQNLLLNLKRNVFNERLNSKEDLSDFIYLLSENTKNMIFEYLSLVEKISECMLAFEKDYDILTEEIRGKFKILIKDPALQKGLLLSSKSLSRRISPYTKKPTKKFSRNDFKAELGLLKYLTRLKTKTSPFSTFTNLTIATHIKPEKKIISFTDCNSSVISHVRLNNAIYMYIQTLLFKYPKVYFEFPVTLNPTIDLENDEFIFLTNHNNIESFQRISFTPLLKLIRSTLENKKHFLTFQGLVNELKEYVEASVEEISKYVKKIIDYGFLEFDLEISGLDPDWDIKLREKFLPLENNNVPFAKDLRNTLKEIRNIAVHFENSDAQQREVLLTEAFEILKTFCIALHEAAGLPEEERMNEKELRAIWKNANIEEEQNRKKKKIINKQIKIKEEEPFRKRSSTWFRFKPESIFYEDTTLETDMEITPSSLKTIVSSLNVLLQHMQPFDGWQYEKQKMADYFIDQYEKEEAVSLITFYENYYRDIKQPEAENKKQNGKDVESEKENSQNNSKQKPNKKQNKIDPFTTKNSVYKRWQNNFLNLLDSSNLIQEDIVRIERTHIQKVSKKSKLEINSLDRCSFGMFIQLFTEKNEAGVDQMKGVVNSVFPGFGRMMSRFMHLFPEEVTDELRTWNNKLAENDILIENCDASCFNANIHPPLMPREIRMPGSQNTFTEERQIPIIDLQVVERNGELYLRSKKNKKNVFIFDLGFQGLKGHSQLFQLLSHFTLARFFNSHILISTINKHFLSQKYKITEKKNRPQVLYHPRIIFEDKIILQRKRWTVPISKLPMQNPHESNSRYFLRANNWRKSHHIPSEVFITIFSRDSNSDTIKKKMKKIGKDDYKPQYIDFQNPLLVNLFSKLVGKVQEELKIEEMLPDSKQLLKSGNNKYVTEHMVQWYYF